MKSEKKICQNCQKEFTIEPEDFTFYGKMKVPAPTFCPECRMVRRMSHRNERSLFNNNCDLCGKKIISMYKPGTEATVCCQECLDDDKWGGLDFGVDYDFSKTFFEQFRELVKRVPQVSLVQSRLINSPWINYEIDSKNCYLNVGGHENKNSAFNQYLLQSQDCFDNFWLMKSDFSYENIIGDHNYQVFNSTFCYFCQETYFSFDCKNCSNIIGCSGLRNKKFCIFNKQISKEEYEKFRDENLDGSYEKWEKLKKESNEFWKSVPQRTNFILQSINCSGDLITESKNCHHALMTEKSENSSYVIYILDVKDSYDITADWQEKVSYEVIAGFRNSNILFSTLIVESSFVEYSRYIFNSNNCFGCVGLKNKNYCIFNKQYSKEEYFKMVEKIKKHMNEMPFVSRNGSVYKYGEFFPPEVSFFDYNDTVAKEWFPKTNKEIEKEGWNPDTKNKDNKYEFSDYEIPDNIVDVQDDILEKVLKCEVSGKAYKITKMELDFYRRFKIPIPRVSPFERHKRRLNFLTRRSKKHKRNCFSCGREVISVYSKKEFPKIYCEQCYNQEVV